MIFERLQRLALGEVPPHTLKERNAKPLVGTGQYSVCGGLAYAMRHDLECLADVNDECRFSNGDVNPVAGFVQGL